MLLVQVYVLPKEGYSVGVVPDPAFCDKNGYVLLILVCRTTKCMQCWKQSKSRGDIYCWRTPSFVLIFPKSNFRLGEAREIEQMNLKLNHTILKII
jgi:hypothetical protein